jgi:O-antigen/teichoic acid export membrane protein
VVFIFGLVVCLVALTWSGVQWAAAKKDKEKKARAKRRTIWSLVGLVVTFLSYFILLYLIVFFGLDLL